MVLMCKDGDYRNVADVQVKDFIKKGYAVADGVPTQSKDELAALKAENAALKVELESYKEQVFKMLTPVEGPGDQKEPEAPTDQEEPGAPADEKKPQKGSSKKAEKSE